MVTMNEAHANGKSRELGFLALDLVDGCFASLDDGELVGWE